MKKISLLLALALVAGLLSGCAETGPIAATLGAAGRADPGTLPNTSPKSLKTLPIAVTTLPSKADIAATDDLPTFASFEDLLEKVNLGGYGYWWGDEWDVAVVEDAFEPQIAPAPADTNAAMPAASADAGGSSRQDDHSTTNVQKEGVDEGDIIKTDGKYIYTFNNGTVAIVEVDGAKMDRRSTIRVKKDLSINEMYVVGDRLVLSASSYKDIPLPKRPAESGKPDANYRNYWWPEYFTRAYTNYLIYDISNRRSPKLLQELEVSGTNMSSRVIGGKLYYVTTQYPGHYYIPFDTYREFGIDINPEWILPAWSNSEVGANDEFIPPENLRYFPDSDGTAFMMVGVLDLSGKDASEPQAYYGGGEIMYMDMEYMALACHTWGNFGTQTYVYRFTLAQDGIVYTANATVPGQVIDQYSIDIHNGNLRVATSNTSGNKVTVFDRDMKKIGETEGFAETETVRSVRFMGDMCYVVTFRNTDPLFCIDLTNPKNPLILGELKIPGFSQYLHPVGDGLLVGFGRDTVENEWGGFWDVGFKVSLFDVENPRDPREVSVLAYSDEEFYSHTFTNPRSILVDRNQQRFMFPAVGMEYKDFDPTIPNNDIGAYIWDAEELWYGVIVVDVRGEKLVETQIIKHGTVNADDTGNMWRYFSYSNSALTVRSVYIGNTLYTTGNGTMNAYNYTTFKHLGTIALG